MFINMYICAAGDKTTLTIISSLICLQRVVLLQQLCSNFQAGSALRTKGKAKKLDEKGVLGSSCRHDIPLLFCNLMHGERYFDYILHIITIDYFIFGLNTWGVPKVSGCGNLTILLFFYTSPVFKQKPSLA